MTEPGLSGRQLAELRKSVFMPARHFAKGVGYSYQHYRRIEAAKDVEVPVGIKMKFKSVLLGHVEKVKLATTLLQVWDPGVQKLDIRAKNGGKLILSRKGVSSD